MCQHDYSHKKGHSASPVMTACTKSWLASNAWFWVGFIVLCICLAGLWLVIVYLLLLHQWSCHVPTSMIHDFAKRICNQITLNCWLYSWTRALHCLLFTRWSGVTWSFAVVLKCNILFSCIYERLRMRCQGNSHKPVKSRIERFLTVTVAYNSIKRAQSPNLPNHRGMSAGSLLNSVHIQLVKIKYCPSVHRKSEEKYPACLTPLLHSKSSILWSH